MCASLCYACISTCTITPVYQWLAVKQRCPINPPPPPQLPHPAIFAFYSAQFHCMQYFPIVFFLKCRKIIFSAWFCLILKMVYYVRLHHLIYTVFTFNFHIFFIFLFTLLRETGRFSFIAISHLIDGVWWNDWMVWLIDWLIDWSWYFLWMIPRLTVLIGWMIGWHLLWMVDWLIAILCTLARWFNAQYRQTNGWPAYRANGCAVTTRVFARCRWWRPFIVCSELNRWFPCRFEGRKMFVRWRCCFCCCTVRLCFNRRWWCAMAATFHCLDTSRWSLFCFCRKKAKTPKIAVVLPPILRNAYIGRRKEHIWLSLVW